jgi:ribosomal protein S1
MPRAKKSDLDVSQDEQQTLEPAEEPEQPPEDAAMAEESDPADIQAAEPPAEEPKKRAAQKAESTGTGGDAAAEVLKEPTKRRAPRKEKDAPILTITSGDEVVTQEDLDDMVWHEIQNANRTRKILTGTLGGMERAENGNVIAVVYFKDLRVVIPMSEMMINLSTENGRGGEMITRQTKILGNSIGAEIDFVVKGIDSRTRSVVASRKDAMMKKRKRFFLETDADGQYRVCEGRIVQARVIAVAEKVVRVEIFGVETAILARDLTYDWMGDARERYSVGDQILVRILEVNRDSLEDIRVKADVKSISGDTGRDNLMKCKVQGKYAGKVTDVHKGVVFVRLGIGVNAVAHACYDSRMPGKKDDVSFAVTRIDEERNIALGIITRVIKQNL